MSKLVTRLVEDAADELDVPTKIFASSGREDQRSNQPYKRKYSEEFIKVGFTCILINEPRPQCVVCSEVLVNESLKAGKWKSHLAAKHPKFIDKPMPFFRRLEKELLIEKKSIARYITILEKSQKGIVF